MLYDELVEQSQSSRGHPFNSLGYIAGSLAIGYGEKKYFNAMERWTKKSMVSKHLGEFIDFNKELGAKTKRILSNTGRMGPFMSASEYPDAIMSKFAKRRRASFYASKDFAGKLGVAKAAMNSSTKRLSLMSSGLKRAIGVVTFFELMDVGVQLMTGQGRPGVSRAAQQREQAYADDELMMDTRTAYTQRQRAIQAIHDSQLSVGRAIIGQEASYLHR